MLQLCCSIRFHRTQTGIENNADSTAAHLIVAAWQTTNLVCLERLLAPYTDSSGVGGKCHVSKFSKNRQMSHKSLEIFSRAPMPREAYVMHFPAHRRMCKCHGQGTRIRGVYRPYYV